MYTKNYYPAILIALVLLLVMSCKNDEDWMDDPDHNHPNDSTPGSAVEKRLLTQTIRWFVVQPEGDTGGHHGGGNPGDTTFLHYDISNHKYNSKGLVTEINGLQFIYDAYGNLSKTVDGNNTVHYLRNGDTLAAIATSSGYYDGGNYTDTTRFYYSAGRITTVTSTHEKAVIVFSYDNDNNVAGKFITRSFNNQTFCDSLLYTWKNGNVTQLISCAGPPNQNMKYRRQYKYDNHPCYISTAGYPEDYLLVRELTQFYGKYPLIYYDPYPWRFNCANNPVEFTEMTEFKTVHNHYHIDYDKDGYPTKIVGTYAIISLVYDN